MLNDSLDEIFKINKSKGTKWKLIDAKGWRKGLMEKKNV